MKREEAARLVAVCLAMWPSHAEKVNVDALIDGWSMALHGVDYGDANEALATYLQTGTFFPAPAEIRTLVNATKPALDNALYREYMRLRFKLQRNELTAADDRALSGVEKRLGIARSERPVMRPLLELVQP